MCTINTMIHAITFTLRESRNIERNKHKLNKYRVYVCMYNDNTIQQYNTVQVRREKATKRREEHHKSRAVYKKLRKQPLL